MAEYEASGLLEVVYAYLDESISLRELSEYLIPHLPRLFSLPEAADADLAATIELGLAEISAGHRSEDGFRQMLMEYLVEQGISWPPVIPEPVDASVWKLVPSWAWHATSTDFEISYTEAFLAV